MAVTTLAEEAAASLADMLVIHVVCGADPQEAQLEAEHLVELLVKVGLHRTVATEAWDLTLRSLAEIRKAPMPCPPETPPSTAGVH
jgi:hypothetical protein